jgi:hypothetical protein
MGPRSNSDSRPKVRLFCANGAAQIHSKTFRGNRVRDYFPFHCLLADYHRSKSAALPQTLASLQDYALATIIKSARNWMSERPNLSDIRLALVLPM